MIVHVGTLLFFYLAFLCFLSVSAFCIWVLQVRIGQQNLLGYVVDKDFKT